MYTSELSKYDYIVAENKICGLKVAATLVQILS